MTPLGQCKCSATIEPNHPYTSCCKCGEPLSIELVSKLSNKHTQTTGDAAALRHVAAAARAAADSSEQMRNLISQMRAATEAGKGAAALPQKGRWRRYALFSTAILLPLALYSGAVGFLLYQAGEMDGSRFTSSSADAARWLQRLTPWNPKHLIYEGLALEYKGEPGDALQVYTRALSHAGCDADCQMSAYSARGGAYWKL